MFRNNNTEKNLWKNPITLDKRYIVNKKLTIIDSILSILKNE